MPTIITIEEGYRTLMGVLEIYKKEKNDFYSNIEIADTYKESDNVYRFAVWPISVMAHACVDLLKYYHENEQVKDAAEYIFNQFEKYRYLEIESCYFAYTASKYFSGNNDLYFDDNAQISSAYTEYFMTCHNKKYLFQAGKIVKWLIDRGQLDYRIDETSKMPIINEGRGMRWHYVSDKDKKIGGNCIATSESAIAALRFVEAYLLVAEGSFGAMELFRQNFAIPMSRLMWGLEEHVWQLKLIRFSIDCLNFIYNVARDKSSDGYDLISDSRWWNENEQCYQGDCTKFSYNQGTPISALCRLYRVLRIFRKRTPDKLIATFDEKSRKEANGIIASVEKYRSWAASLAFTAIDKNTPIFDRDVEFHLRYYRDNTAFLSLLIESFADFTYTFKSLYPYDEASYMATDIPDRVKNPLFPPSSEDASTTGGGSDRDVYAILTDRIGETLRYLNTFGYNFETGYYFRSLNGNQNTEITTDEFNAYFKTNRKFEPSSEERTHTGKRVEDEAIVPTLMGQAAGARIFLQGARLLICFQSLNNRPPL